MSAPVMPQNFQVQTANAQVFLSWNPVVGATIYSIERSLDEGMTWVLSIASSVPRYLDTSVTVGVQYTYRVQASDGVNGGAFTSPLSAVPTNTADVSLGQLRLMCKQRADMVNSNFVSDSEWNLYINQSYFELYDLLVTTYEDYFVQTPYVFTADGTSAQYTLPTDFYKLMGVDFGLFNNTNAWAALNKFNFIARNKYIYPQLNANPIGPISLQYRLVGNTLMFIPTPSSGQYLRVWYIPKLTELLQDTDILNGISGWSEYVLVDAAIKAMQKEESDVSVLMMQKQALLKRIEQSSMNRDEGQPDTISDVRSVSDRWGGYSGESWAGF